MIEETPNQENPETLLNNYISELNKPIGVQAPDTTFSPIELKERLKVRWLRAGLPIFTATPTYDGMEGETTLVDTGVSQSICIYTNGAWHCQTMGAVGTQGSQGYQGPQGPQGIIGTQGTQGYQGPTGPKNTGQIFLSSAGGWPTTTSGCGTNTLYQLAAGQPNVYVMNFTASTSNNFSQWDLIMPSDWDAGTVSAYPYWTSSAFGIDIGVVWSFRGRSFANDDALAQAWPAYVSASMSGGTSNDLYIGSALIAGISGAGANEFCAFEIGRWPTAEADSLTANASLIGVRLDYTRS